MKLVVLGAPGAGKGTQAHSLASYFNVSHISTGEIFRDHMKKETELGNKIMSSMQDGSLVSDDIAISVLSDCVKSLDLSNGFILDGFPRTLQQAQILSDIVGELDKVIYIHVPDDEILRRMSGRKICSVCGVSYHDIYKPSKAFGVCDVCCGALVLREDDLPEVVSRRLLVYHRLTKPVISFFSDNNLLLRIDGIGDSCVITDNIVRALRG